MMNKVNLFQVVKDTFPIEDILNMYGIKGREKGGRTLISCPSTHHQDKNPSCSVYKHSNSFNCFGCGAGGDIINFVQAAEDCSPMEALKKIAEHFNFDLPKDKRDKISPSIETYNINAKLQNEVFRKNVPRSIKQLLWARGIRTKEEYDLWGFGYSPLTLKIDQDCTKVGLNKAIRDRITIPLQDERGRICGFVGRAINKKNLPKYINSAENPVYKKQNFLFGVAQAKTKITSSVNAIVITEGYFDAITAIRHNVPTVAIGGVHLTKNHAQIIKSLSTHKVILAFDGDDAGYKATDKAIKTLLTQDISEIEVMLIPSGHDLDSILRQDIEIDIISWTDWIAQNYKGSNMALANILIEDYIKLMPKSIGLEMALKQIATLLRTSITALKYQIG